MALLDERGVGGGEDVVVVGSGERLALDELPVALAVAGPVVAHDGLRVEADADPGGASSHLFAQGLGQGAASGELASGGVRGDGEFRKVTGQKQGGEREERYLCSLVLSLEDGCRNWQHRKGDQIDRTLLGKRGMQADVRDEEKHQSECEGSAGEGQERSILAPPVTDRRSQRGEGEQCQGYARDGAEYLK